MSTPRHVIPQRLDGPVVPAIRLIAFPHAGGNAGVYRDWRRYLADDVELISFTLPGHVGDDGAAAITAWPDLVDAVVAMVVDVADGLPFAFFGHSFGALLAFEVTRALRDSGAPLPACLLASAHRAPDLPSRNRAPGRQTHALPADRFAEVIRAFGYLPDAALADPVLVALIEPPLRADLRLDELHDHTPAPPLPVDCVVYGGEADPGVGIDELQAWRRHFGPDRAFDLALFPGGHFYTLDRQADLFADISRRLDAVLARGGPSLLFAPLPANLAPTGADDWIWPDFRRVVRRQPDSLALVDGDRRWTYAELEADTVLLARRLTALGIGKADAVGVLMPHCAEHLIALMAILAVGATACLFENNWSDNLIEEFAAAAGARAIVTLPAQAPRLPPDLRRTGAVLLPPGWAETLRADAATLPPLPDVAIAPDAIAFVSMTSGSTGKPKAVLTTHRGSSYCFAARFALFPYGEAEREGLNVFFAWECLRPLLAGRAAVIIPDDVIFDPPRLVRLIEAAAITRLVTTTSLLESLLDHPGLAPTLVDRLAHMTAWFLMGEVVPGRVVASAARLFPPGLRLVNAYSTWESLDIAYADLLPPLASPGNSPFAPVGHLLPGSAGVLVDDDGAPVAKGRLGELLVAGPGIAPGYLNDPARTAERFVALPECLRGRGIAGETAYRTGDLGRILPDGRLEIAGRIDSTVKLRGFKVSLHAVERVLETADGIVRAVVVPRKFAATGQPEALIAYLLGTDGAPPETALARARQAARRKLPEYAVPRHFIGLASLPLRQGESRKLDLAALPPPPDDRAAPRDPVPLAGLEGRIAGLWREILGRADIAPDDSFFALGGNSLEAARLVGLLSERLGVHLPVVDVFQFATLAAMAERCGAATTAATPAAPRRDIGRNPKLAIVGMAGRFPGAADIDRFWANLVAGHDSLRRFSRDELAARGVAAEVLDHPDWVAAGQVVDDADAFDARFWGIGAHEAEIIDPQHRLFIETAWAALEQAGYARRDNPWRHRTGVFAACGIDGYLVHHLDGGGLRQPLDPGRLFLTEIGNEKDYIATRVAYLMDLGGPAVTVTSACSSALVAVAQAAQAVMSGQCDMAIAGGSAINFPNFGYCYEDGLVGSRDGRVRPFDAEAGGTLFGDGVGAVVLKRLDDALADGDTVWAVLSGFGLSNDGRLKAGYAAPNAAAQTRAIVDAMTMAGIAAEQISYVECHATATHVGDAIELKGLRDAFLATRAGDAFAPGSCVIGSVKGNIGHANCAAGITGLIKTVLALHHRRLPATVNFVDLNPKLVDFVDTDGTPFTIAAETRQWAVVDPATQLPRRAGVSSFGIGGTNAHVVLEEAPPALPPSEATIPDASGGFVRARHILTVSARTPGALAANLRNLAAHLRRLDAAGLACAVHTLHTAREAHPLRLACVVDADPVAAAGALVAAVGTLPARPKPARAATVAFCFSGQGSQHAGMARDLYRSAEFAGFHRHFDAAAAELGRHLGLDVARLVLEADDAAMRRPLVTQCGLFLVEYALAATLVDLGIRPVAVGGHSIGEYAAAVIADVLTLPEAAALVAARAAATENLTFADPADGTPGQGGMLSVAGDEAPLRQWLAGRDDLWLAVENAPDQCVVAGLAVDLDRAEPELIAAGLRCLRVPVSHPFHTDLMAPVAAAIDAVSATIPPRAPRIPMTSNLTGGWRGEADRSVAYWGRHMLSTVRFRDNVATLLRWQPDVIVEIGPGAVLAGLVAKCLAGATEDLTTRPLLLTAMRHARGVLDDAAVLTQLLARLWQAGVAIDWRRYHHGEVAAAGVPLTRAQLPTYAFEPDRYWVAPHRSIHAALPEPTPPLPTPATACAEAVIESAISAVAPTSPWLVRLGAPRTTARLRLYCFAFAGGGSRAFDDWSRTFPPTIDVVAVELPGRNARAEGPVPADAAADARQLAALSDAIRTDAGALPIAFCGLSFGAALASELLAGPLADLDRAGRVVGFAIVGRAPVHGPAPVDHADPESFLLAPPEIRANPFWREVFLPVLLADLAWDARIAARLGARFRDGGDQPLLRCPVQLHCGLDDPSFAWIDAGKWADFTAAGIDETFYYPGGHDFIERDRRRIGERLVRLLAATAAPPPAAAVPAPLHRVCWSPLEVPRLVPLERVAVIDPSRAGPSLAGELVAALSAPSARVVLDWRRSPDPDPASGCLALFAAFKALSEAGAQGHILLVLPATAASGPLAGLSRVLPLEEPGLRLQRILVDAADVSLDPLVAAAVAYPDETDLHWRAGQLLAERLRPCAEPTLPPGVLGASGGRYLITGGHGALGRVLIDWLIDRQGVAAANIAIVARAGRPAHRPGLVEIVADLADPAALAAALAPAGRFDGVFHLAGQLDDGTLANLDAARFAAVLAPKLALAALMPFARDWGSRWIVAYSSTSALLGTPGQANYAAANAYLDHLAQWPLDRRDPPVATIDWGTWGEAGMAARNARALARARADGETPLATAEALDALGGVIATAVAGGTAGWRFAACRVDWDRSPWRQLPKVCGLAPASMSAAPAASQPAAAATASPRPPASPAAPVVASDDDGADPVRRFLARRVRHWDDDAELSALGFDSLDIAGLRGGFSRQFGLKAPLSIFAAPNQTLGRLAARLSELLSQAAPAAPGE